MSKIGLIDVDGHGWPSLPLMKLSAWHKTRGDEVDPWFGMDHYDKVYASKVFDFTPDIKQVIIADEIVRGGTGYPDADMPLPDAIEHCYPDYELYPSLTKNTAYGFLTRGCPHGCGYCVVPDKEGHIAHHVADLDEWWRGQRYITLLDPNLLACRDHMRLLRQLADSGAWVDFTQGLGIRLTNEENIDAIRRIKAKNIHFAWDNPKEDLTGKFIKFKKLSGIEDYRKLIVYVLTNYDSTHDEDLYRVYTLRKLGYWPYVMIYDKVTAPKITRQLQRWVNMRSIFQSVPLFNDYRATLEGAY